MLNKKVLETQDLAAVLDAVYEYNRLGQVLALIFLDAEGKPVSVAGVEIVSQGTGLAVRTKPDKSPEEEALASMYRPILDPRMVPMPQSIGELAEAGG